MDNNEVAKKILDRLESQRFANWYNDGGDFDTYITVEFPKGHANHVSRKMILDDIKQMFDLEEHA